MLRNYLVVALRTLRKQPVYTFINVAGLALGLACCLLIFLYVRDEVTFDRFHEREETIYRVTGVMTLGGEARLLGATPPPLAAALVAELPEVRTAVRLWRWFNAVQQGSDVVEEAVLYADPDFFDVFSFPLVAGEASSALRHPHHVVLSEEAARRYFNTTAAVGQSLSIRLGDTFQEFTVAAVAARPPDNSSIRFDFVLPFANVAAVRGASFVENWSNLGITTFVLLHPESEAGRVAAKLRDVIEKYGPEEKAGFFEETQLRLDLQPLAALHLNPEIATSSGLQTPSDPLYSFLLSGAAFLILLIACINFTNLSIGRSMSRAREVGVRKVVGAQRRHLLLQFWGEAVLLSLFALGAGLGLVELFLPTFSALSGKALTLRLGDHAGTLAACLLLVLLAGLLGGSYPALVLSRFQPAETLKGRLRLAGRHLFTRALVAFQFTLTIFLIAGTLVMTRQLDYMKHKELGYDTAGLVGLPVVTGEGERLVEIFRTELAGRGEVAGVTGASGSQSRTSVEVAGAAFDTYHDRVHYDYLETFGMKLREGRAFSRAFPTDRTDAVVVNQAFVRRAGLEHPVGKPIGFTYGTVSQPTIVGVVEDFHFQSLHAEIEPLVLHLDADVPVGMVWVRIRPDDVPEALALLENTWQRIAPLTPFSYAFLEETNARQYRAEERWHRITAYAALFTILIACLGLFGLAALTVRQRTKEIGIRKVLGASAASVTVLLSKDFVRLVLVAFIGAAPVAYLAARHWLDHFAYRIDLRPGPFLLAGTLVLAVACATVFYQTLRTALANPVESLRNE